VTGVGVVCALGADQHAVWEAMIAGRNGIGALSLFDASGCLSDRAAEAPPLCRPALVSRREWARASRTDRLCLMAAFEAVTQAGLEPGALPGGFGVSLGSSTAGMLESEHYVRQGLRRGFGRAPVSRVLRLPSSAPADAVARAMRADGPRLSNMTACASSSASVGFAADMIRSGEASGAIAGGGDALCLLTYSGFHSLRLLDARPARPFDATRQGLSLGEGAGMLVLEPWDDALARGAQPLAEFLDYGASCDAHHMTAPHPEGRGAAAAMREALHRSGCAPGDIAHVNAHGTGTALNDATEASALRSVFGAGGGAGPCVTSSKSMIGHLLGGAGGVEAVVLVLTLRHQMVPPTLGWTRSDDGTALDVVHGQPRSLPVRDALSNSFGFGGTNTSLLMRRADP
jgi:3-oxoacyl-[acyl-carrier-protein] synthase II